MNKDDKQGKIFPDKEAKFAPGLTCRTCIFRQSVIVGRNTYLQYCTARYSNMTKNGLLRIKVYTPACNKFQN